MDSISTGFVKGLFDYTVASYPVTASELASRSGIDRDALTDDDAPVAVERWYALWRAAGELSGDPALPMHFGRDVICSDMSVVGMICACCPTLRQSFRQLHRFRNLNRNARERLEVDEGEAVVTMRVVAKLDREMARTIAEWHVARMVHGLRMSTGGEIRLMRITFEHDRPDHHAELESYLELRPSYRQPATTVQFSSRHLDRRLALYQPYLNDVLSKHAEQLLERAARRQTRRHSDEVQRVIVEHLHHGTVTIQQVCKELGTTRQTLYRRLAAEGTSFKELHDSVRLRLAQEYLANPAYVLDEVTYLVGFSETSAFCRAFKRWTGVTPSEKRAEMTA